MEAIHALAAAETGDAGEGGVELILVRSGGVEDDPEHEALTAEEGVEAMDERVTVNAVGGAQKGRGPKRVRFKQL